VLLKKAGTLFVLPELLHKVWGSMCQLTGVGWPSRAQSTWHKVRSSLSFRKPVSTHMEYRAGAA